MFLGSLLFCNSITVNHSMYASIALLLHSLKVVQVPFAPGNTTFLDHFISLICQFQPFGPPNLFGVLTLCIVNMNPLPTRIFCHTLEWSLTHLPPGSLVTVHCIGDMPEVVFFFFRCNFDVLHFEDLIKVFIQIFRYHLCDTAIEKQAHA